MTVIDPFPSHFWVTMSVADRFMGFMQLEELRCPVELPNGQPLPSRSRLS
jgi:hypothetical protein